MDKNLFLAVSLSILVYAAWFGFIEKRLNPLPTARTPIPATATPTVTPPQRQTDGQQQQTTELKPQAGFADSVAPPLEKDETESARLGQIDLVLRSHGAAIVSWNYHGPLGVVDLVPKPPVPGFLSTFESLTFKRVDDPSRLVFAATRPDKLRVVKEFLSGADDNLPQIKLTIENPTDKAVESGDWTLSVGPGLGTIPTEEEENVSLTRSLGFIRGENGLNGKIEVFKQPGDVRADYRWIGVDNRYSALLPKTGDFSKAEALDSHRVV